MLKAHTDFYQNMGFKKGKIDKVDPTKLYLLNNDLPLVVGKMKLQTERDWKEDMIRKHQIDLDRAPVWRKYNQENQLLRIRMKGGAAYKVKVTGKE
jgi:hypothetical protein